MQDDSTNIAGGSLEQTVGSYTEERRKAELKFYRSTALTAVKELKYSKAVGDRVREAKTINDISRIMFMARIGEI